MSFNAHGGGAAFGAVLDTNATIDALSAPVSRSAPDGAVVGDRAPAEDALRPSAENLRLIVDTIPGLVAIATADGTLELVQSSRLGVLRPDL